MSNEVTFSNYSNLITFNITNMKKTINKIGRALHVVLMAPIKLPGKALNMLKYIALGLGVLEQVLDDPDKNGKEEPSPAKQIQAQKEKEVPDETK